MATKIKVYGIAIVLGLLLSVTVAYGQVLAKQYKIVAFGPYVTGVYCLDGQQPLTTKAGLMLIVSCPVVK